jgi:S-DNA-T family DNA segregation ATPase FtsK/SpoIIIE
MTTMAKKSKVKAKPAEPVTMTVATAGRVVGRVLCAVGAVLLLLSVVSYNAEDSQILAGGLSPHAPLHNWIGLLGAVVSRTLLHWFGFASYFAVFVLLLCAGSRLASPRVRLATPVYFAGIIASICGLTMFLGIFPGFLEGAAARLNIAETPGGVIGQRFCAPWTLGQTGGWLSYVVHPAGSAIISLTLATLGCATLWYFDWHLRAVYWWGVYRERRNQGDDYQAEKERRLREREKRRRELDKEERKAEKSPAAETPPPEPDPPAPEQTAEPAVELPESSGGVIAAPARPARRKPRGKYKLPSVTLLHEPTESQSLSPKEIEAKKDVLQQTLESFGIDAIVGDSTSGPRVTLFEIKPAPGVRVEKISNLQNNFAMKLKAENLRILAPIPGKDSVGIEVPNTTSAPVPLRGLLDSGDWKRAKAQIPIALGMSIAGKPAVLDLARAPHLLIAGATGSGKSVCMNTLILSLLYRFSPEELKLIMVDPKVVEFSGYNSLPHLVAPVITDVKKVPIALRWALAQMEWRYQVLAKVGVRNLESFNSRKPEAEPVLDDDGEPIPARLPFLIIIIDELADIMMTAKADVETSLARIAQLARAVGIHAVVATQRPSVNVITGVIKANFPTRIAFQVSSVVDSRTIIDGKGAESLLGRGDMLFRPPGAARLERIQGTMVEDEEITKIVGHVSAQAEPEFVEDIFSPRKAGDPSSAPVDAPDGEVPVADGAPEADGAGAGVAFVDVDISDLEPDSDEALIQKAILCIKKDRKPSISHIQRRLRIGYNRAALIIEQLEERGLIGPQIGTAPRQILMDLDDADG